MRSIATASRAINHDLAVGCGDVFYFGGGHAPNADVRSTDALRLFSSETIALLAIA